MIKSIVLFIYIYVYNYTYTQYIILNNVYYYHLPFTNLLSRSNNSIKINDTKIHTQFYSNN